MKQVVCNDQLTYRFDMYLIRNKTGKTKKEILANSSPQNPLEKRKRCLDPFFAQMQCKWSMSDGGVTFR
ncbi:hypothetical protein CUN85_02285 [Methanolobus halotolerans]|uniref:Uncharacterized protein n=1 Tax=Methanolobus halotolerans TaxID=2052935 RepID=A0A4E0PXZ0_9EURY|nr:hypothetical protein CUN85_02285 [Methanolobus halotolerans]